jgi:ankyrin repeat protein
VELLLEKGADPNISNDIYNTPIFYAIRNRNLDVIKLLIKHGANLDIKGYDNVRPIQGDEKVTPLDLARRAKIDLKLLSPG